MAWHKVFVQIEIEVPLDPAEDKQVLDVLAGKVAVDALAVWDILDSIITDGEWRNFEVKGTNATEEKNAKG